MFECPICTLEIDSQIVVTLPCNHQYCSDCVQNWFNINRRCPECRIEVPLHWPEEVINWVFVEPADPEPADPVQQWVNQHGEPPNNDWHQLQEMIAHCGGAVQISPREQMSRRRQCC